MTITALALLAALGGCATPPGAWGVSDDPLALLQEPDPGYEEELATLVASITVPEEEPGEAPGLSEGLLLRLPERRAPQEAPEAEVPEAAAEDGGWGFGAGFFAWIPGLDGHVTTKGNKAELDLSPYDFGKVIVENFSFAGEIAAEVSYDDFFLRVALVYLDLSDEADINLPLLTLDVDIEMTIVIVPIWAGYRFLDVPLGKAEDGPRLALAGLLGGTLYYIDVEVDGSGPLQDYEGSETWFEPGVGLRADLRFNESLSIQAQGYIAGFGLTSDFGWGMQATLNWHPSDSFTMKAGWMILDSDYQDGNGDDEFEWDLALSGPGIAFQWTF